MGLPDYLFSSAGSVNSDWMFFALQFWQAYNLVLNSSEETVVADEDLIDIDTLLEDVEDDSFMSMAFE